MIYQILGKFVFVAAGFLIVPFGLLHYAHAQSTQDRAGQLMLLKNGSVLQGFIERTANHYIIQTRPGNRMHLPFEKVEVIADTYSEIYWRRLATIGATNTADQEALFHWCLRYRLWDEAANQLEIFKAIHTDEAFLQRLQRQLSTALAERDRQLAAAAKKADQAANSIAKQTSSQSLTPICKQTTDQSLTPIANPAVFPVANQTSNPADPESSQAVAQVHAHWIDIFPEGHAETHTPELAHRYNVVSPAGNESFFENFEPVFRPLPSVFEAMGLDSVAGSNTTIELMDRAAEPLAGLQSEPQVIQVGFEEAGERQPNASPAFDLSVRELEQYIKSLPKTSLSQFRSRVEPILISNCSDCHQKDKQTTEMPILLRSKRLPVTMRMSQRNLLSAIRYIDAENLDTSALLKAAVTAHGGQESAALTEDSADYQAVRDWIGLVTQTANAKAQNPVATLIATENDSSENPEQSSVKGSAEPKRMLRPMSAQNLPASAGLPQTASVDRREYAPRPIQIRHSPNIGKLEPLPPTIGEIPSLTQPAERFMPRDDFDPEIFNRRFGTAKVDEGER